MIDPVPAKTMLPDISRQFLTQMMEGNEIAGVTVDVGGGEFAYTFG
jgi:type VI secretion system protein VasG